MKLVDKKTGSLVDVPDEQAAQAFSSGNYGVPKGQPVPVVGSDGTVGTVAPEHLQDVIEGGGRFASEQELHQATIHEKYGGLGGAGIAAAEGAVRGLSLGLSDPLAIGAGRLFGGEKGATAVREHLAGEKEEHPWLSTGSEIGGAAIPMLLSGGAAAPAVGAMEEAGAIARIGEGVRTLGALPRGVGALGDFAEHAVSGVLGAPGASVLGRGAQAATKMAVRGLVEGGLFGAGQEISESALENQELTGEKLAHAVGHGALTAGLLGGALGGVGSVVGEGAAAVLGKLSPKLDDAAGEQAWRWLNPRVKEARIAMRRAGGTDEVGKTVLKYVLRPLVEKEGMAAAVLDDAGKLELVQKALASKGAEIGELTQGAAGATLDLQEDMLEPILKRIKSSQGKVLAGDQVNALEELKADVVRLLGKDHEVMPPEIPVRRTPAEVQEMLRTDPKAVEALNQTGKLPDWVTFKNIREPIPKEALDAVKVPVADAIAQRRALQDRVFKETQQLDPKARVEILREVSHDWNEAIYKRLDEFSKEAGEDAGQKLRALNKEYQQLSVAKDVLDYNTGRFAANRNFSLSDQLWGAAHFAGALASGHPLTAAGAIGTSMAHRFVRHHGNAYASLMLDRLASWGGVSRATAEIDEQVDRAIDGVLSAPARRRARAFHTEIGQSDDERFEEERSRVRQLAAVAPAVLSSHLQQRTAPIATHAPNVAAAMQATATNATKFLAAALPPEQMPESLTPQLEQPTATPAQKLHLLRSVDAIQGGPEAILKRVGDGTLTAEDIAAMKEVFPQQYAEISQKLRRKGMSQTKAPSFQTRLSVARFIGQTTDTSQAAPVLQAVQRAYATHPTRAALPRSRAPRMTAAQQMMGPFDTAQYGGGR